MVERLPFEDPKALLQIKTSPFTEGEPEAKKAICPSHTDWDRQQQTDTPLLALPLCSHGLRAPPPPPSVGRKVTDGCAQGVRRLGINKLCFPPVLARTPVRFASRRMWFPRKAGSGTALARHCKSARVSSHHDSARLRWQVSCALQYFRLVFMIFKATMKVNGPGIQNL